MSKQDKIVVVHLSSDDEMKAGKALRFAYKALSHAAGSVLLLSAQGVTVAKRSTGGFTIPGTDKNSLDFIRQFLKDDGRVYVGKECMKVLGIGATDIISGCEPSGPEVNFDLLLSDDTEMISW